MSFPWLTLVGLLPIAGSIIVLALRGRGGRTAAMVFALAELVCGLAIVPMDAAALSEQHSWIATIGAWYALDADGMTKLLVGLTVVLVPIVLLAEWHSGDGASPGRGRPVVTDGVLPPRWSSETFMALALLLEGLTLYVFMASDLLLFYIFFEATLIPMYFLIAGWGGTRRTGAALKFLLFSLLGGLVLLLGVIGMYAVSAAGDDGPSLLTADLTGLPMATGTERWLFAAFFIAFAIKAPMVPVHTWLPDTAEQARPGASSLLVATLDKIGTFGMIRFCLAFFPQASSWATPLILTLAVISILYGAFMAIASKNLLRLVAFTSVSHFGFMVLGIFAFTTTSLTGSIFYMLGHGFSAAAMFLVVGFLVDRRGSALIADFGGAQRLVPVLAGVFLVCGLATLGLPGLANFAGEYLIMSGAWSRHLVFVAVAVVATVLAAVYIMLAYQRVFTGPVTEASEQHMRHDLNGRERAVIAPLIVLMLFFGLVPKPTLDMVAPTAQQAMVNVSASDPEPSVPNGGK